MVHLATTTLLAGLLASTVSAHYYIKDMNGDKSCLRPLVLYAENSPVSGNDIEGQSIICGAAKPLTTAQPACSVKAGSTLTFNYDSQVTHPGPAAIYIARTGAGPWAKIYEDMKYTGAGWSNDRWPQNKVWTATLPKELADGAWVLRAEHLGLHQGVQLGGAQFYIRCIDINVSGGGGQTPSPMVAIPGAYKIADKGVNWNPYAGKNAEYPGYGPAVWKAGSTIDTTTKATTTTTTTTTTTEYVEVPTTTTTKKRKKTTTTKKKST